MKLGGKAAFVTGGGAGIGAAIADAMEREGLRLSASTSGQHAVPAAMSRIARQS